MYIDPSKIDQVVFHCVKYFYRIFQKHRELNISCSHYEMEMQD